MRTIAQRELRNDVSRILREVAAGEEITVTVRGRPVAELRPATEGPQRFAPVKLVASELRALGSDPEWTREQREEREQLGYLEDL